MLTHLRRPVAAFAVLILGFYCSPSPLAADSLVIDDENLSFDPLYSATVYGFRAFPISKIVNRDGKSGFGINASVLSRSLDAIAPGEPMTLQELDLRSLSSSGVLSYAPVLISSDYEERTTMALQKLSAPASGEYDAGFIVSALSTELIDREFIQRNPGAISDIDFIEFDSDVAMDFLTVYAGLNSLANYEAARVPVTFDQFDNALQQHSELYAVAKLPIGDVEMGMPIVLDPDGVGIEVPDSWTSGYTVKLMLFAITVRDYLDGVEKIDITIKLPRDCIAFDLMPVSYVGDPMSTAGDVETQSVLIETIFGGGIEYQRRLKPVIEAHGLQNNEFGWRLRGEALSFGTTRLAALIRAPKASREVSMESAFVLRGPDRWIVEGSIGISEPEVHVISF